MEISRSIQGYYFQQGYNYVDSTPDGSIKLGGGCQASALLMATRFLEKNPHLSMDNVAYLAHLFELSFFDLEYATRISYVAIPLVASAMLPQRNVLFFHSETFKEIASHDPKTYYAREANRTYLNMPSVSNLDFKFGANIHFQTDRVIKALTTGGVCLPLLNPNVLYNSKNSGTADLLHVVLAVDYDKSRSRIRIIDPDVGFSYMPGFKEMSGLGVLKIKADQLHDMENINRVAKEYHPIGKVDYWVSVARFEKALRYCTTTIV